MGRNSYFVLIALASTGAAVLTGCSSDSGSGSGSSTSQSGSTSSTSSTSAPSTAGSSSQAPSTATTSESSAGAADLEASVANAKKAKRFHITAVGTDKGQPLNLDLHYGSNGVDGSVVTTGTKLKIKVIGQTLYFNAPAAFWKAQGGSEGATVAKMFGDKWVKTTSSSQVGKGFAEFSDPRQFLDQYTSGFEGAPGDVKQVGTSKVDGTPTRTYGDSTGEATIDIASSGTKLPLKIVLKPKKKGEDAATVTLTDWDDPYTVKAPSTSVNLPS